MELSAFITLAGFVIAILALINSEDRSLILLKFTKWDKSLIIIALIIVHYLFSYQWWRDIFGGLSKFEYDNWPTPSVWSYIISIGLLSFFIFKIYRKKFPESKFQQVMDFYDELLKAEEYDFLAKLIKNYHKTNILDYIKFKGTTSKYTNQSDFRSNHPTSKNKNNKSKRNASVKYGEGIYERFFTNEDFVTNIANNNPYLFVEYIGLLNDEKNAHPEFVNSYLKTLIKCKNRKFFKEIRYTMLRQTGNGNYDLDPEKPILYSLFKDAKVAKFNKIWKSVGEQGYYEIIGESKQEASYLREDEIELDGEQDTIWEYRIKAAISFFDIMYREAIVQGINDHMWIYYYEYFTKGLIENVRNNSSAKEPTRNHKLIKEIIDNLVESIEVSLKSGNMGLFKNSYRCLGRCLYPIVTSNISNDFKDQILDSIFYFLTKNSYPDVSNNDNNKIYVFDEGIKMLENPSNKMPLNDQSKEKNKVYLNRLNQLWERRDRYEQDNYNLYNKACRVFKEKIIDKINIQEI